MGLLKMAVSGITARKPSEARSLREPLGSTTISGGGPQLSRGYRQLVGSGYSDAGEWQWALGFIANPFYRFRPSLKFLDPRSSMLCGSDVIAAEVEEVIDLIVG